MHKEIVIISAIVFIIAFFSGVAFGYNTRGAAIGIHNSEMVMMKPHEHEFREVVGEPPTVSMVVTEDLRRGWNLEIMTDGFEFTPERVSTGFVEGEGHAHLYINGVRIGRLYSQWHHIAELPAGMNTITVMLSGNDHTELTHNGEPIAATVEIFVE